MRITGRQLRQIIKEEVTRMLNEAPAAAIAAVKAYKAKADKGFKTESEMQSAKRALATALKGVGVTTESGILDALQAGGVGGDSAVSFAAELLSMQKK